MDKKELRDREKALDLSEATKAYPQSLDLRVRDHHTITTEPSYRPIDFSIAYCSLPSIAPGQRKIREVMICLEKEILAALQSASKQLEEIALQPWETE